MPKTIIFCCLRSLRPYTEGSGIRKMIKSLKMLTAEEKYQMGRVERHLSAILGAMVARGTQAMDRIITWTKDQMVTKPISQNEILLTSGLLKMRRNCRRKDILTTLLARL